jgi:hypothetical protein
VKKKYCIIAIILLIVVAGTVVSKIQWGEKEKDPDGDFAEKFIKAGLSMTAAIDATRKQLEDGDEQSLAQARQDIEAALIDLMDNFNKLTPDKVRSDKAQESIYLNCCKSNDYIFYLLDKRMEADARNHRKSAPELKAKDKLFRTLHNYLFEFTNSSADVKEDAYKAIKEQFDSIQANRNVYMDQLMACLRYPPSGSAQSD